MYYTAPVVENRQIYFDVMAFSGTHNIGKASIPLSFISKFHYLYDISQRKYLVGRKLKSFPVR